MNLTISDNSAQSRLDGLERFIEFWVGPRRPEYGIDAATLDQARLPDPLRRFYAFGGRWPIPGGRLPYRFRIQNNLLTPGECRVTGNPQLGGAGLIFAYESEGVWQAATLPSGADPGVWVIEGDPGPASRPWRPTQKPLSHFLTTFILHELVLGSEMMFFCDQDMLSICRDAGCKVDTIWPEGEFAYSDWRTSFYLIDNRILACHHMGDPGPIYGFNDPGCADFLKAHGLPYEPARRSF